MNNIKTQNGMSLVELLAAIVILSLVAILATSILIKSFDQYDNISTDAKLRDEAELIITKLTKELYTSKDSETNFMQDATTSSYYVVHKTDGTNFTGFKNSAIWIEGVQYPISNSDVSILWSRTQMTQFENGNLDRSYKIELTLQSKKKEKSKTFKTEVRTVNDLILEEEN